MMLSDSGFTNATAAVMQCTLCDNGDNNVVIELLHPLHENELIREDELIEAEG
jgi:hypothetical protein